MARKKEFDLTEKLAKAKDLFWEKGYHGTSMQDLVDTMQLNPGSIYGTFGDKHTLFMEGLKMYSSQTLADYRAAAARCQTPFNAVKVIIQKAISRSFIEDKACMVVRSTYELAGTDRKAHNLLKKQTVELAELLEDLLKLAQEKNEISRDKDPRMLAFFIISSFAGFWQMQLLFKDKKMQQQLASLLTDSLR
ncbi:MAG TPA: helix-turn-helix domain-containing protein [Chitinophaga sp.]|uniref:TetR/AcrR family transcriptional regulator n=1 Tax=Chitinophaga sp. TaxID=1869181 RepID=UPI002C4A8DF4|nr:helix-turn-helix domain-containing protein [Chitinophaga sp.]HVI47224.1 helix-turn-helix domain-containing protein [Chitinophaga sp.]